MMKKTLSFVLLITDGYKKLNISSTETRIFMKFYTLAYEIVLDHQKHFREDPCTKIRTQVVNVHMHFYR